MKYLECSCNSPEHTMRFSKFDDEDFMYITIHLSHCKFIHRLYNAIKYIFGYSCIYGHFDEFILDKDNRIKLIEILQSEEN